MDRSIIHEISPLMGKDVPPNFAKTTTKRG